MGKIVLTCFNFIQKEAGWELANTNPQDGFQCVAWWNAHLLLIQGALCIVPLRGGGGMSFKRLSCGERFSRISGPQDPIYDILYTNIYGVCVYIY